MKFAKLAALAVIGCCMAGAAYAAGSDVSNAPSQSRAATTSVASSLAVQQTTSIISSAVSGGFAGGAGGFTSGGSGGFAPSGGGGGGFAPGGGDGGSITPSGGTGKSGGSAATANGVWIQGLWSNIDKSKSGLELNGNVYNALAGIDHRFENDVVVGMAFGYERTDLNVKFNSGSLESNGITVAPYMGFKVTPNWSVDLSVGYTRLDYDTTNGLNGTSGSFNADRYFGAANLVGAYASGNWRFQPRTTLSYSREDQDGYTESNGSQVESDTLLLGRLAAGSKVGYAFENFLPYAKLMGEWDFKRAGSVTTANGEVVSSDRAGGVAGVGVEFYNDAFSGSVEIDYNSLFRSDLDVWSTIVRARYEF